MENYETNYKCKNQNDVSVNSLLVDETMSTNTKLIVNHFNIFFASVAAPN